MALDGLQASSNTSALTMGLFQSCTKPSIFPVLIASSQQFTEYINCFSRTRMSNLLPKHYGDVIMGEITSQVTSLSSVYSTLYSDADQRKYQSSASLAFVWGIHRGPVNSPHKRPVTLKMSPFDDVIMPRKWVTPRVYVRSLPCVVN